MRQMYKQKEFTKIYHRFASLDAKNVMQRVKINTKTTENQFTRRILTLTPIGLVCVFIIALSLMPH